MIDSTLLSVDDVNDAWLRLIDPSDESDWAEWDTSVDVTKLLSMEYKALFGRKAAWETEERVPAGDSAGGEWTGGGGNGPATTATDAKQGSIARSALGAKYDKAMSELPKSLFGASSGKLAEAISKDSGGKTDKGTASSFIKSWSSQNIHEVDGQHAALMQAVSEKFGMSLSGAKDEVTAATKEDPELAASYLEDARAYVDAQYAYTQKTLKDMGIDNVPLVRGVAFGSGETPSSYRSAAKDPNGVGVVAASPLSSWTWKSDVAAKFASDAYGYAATDGKGQGYTLSASVPRARIFSTGFTGAGVGKEGEFIVLGGNLDVSVRAVDQDNDGVARQKSKKVDPKSVLPDPDTLPHNRAWLVLSAAERAAKTSVQKEYERVFGRKDHGGGNPYHDERGRFATGPGGKMVDGVQVPAIKEVSNPAFKGAQKIDVPLSLDSYDPKYKAEVIKTAAKYGITPERLLANADDWVKAGLRDQSPVQDLNWYQNMNQWSADTAQKFGVKPEQVAGVISALSPQRPWNAPVINNNILATTAVFQAIADNPTVTFSEDEARQYNDNTVPKLDKNGKPRGLSPFGQAVKAENETLGPMVAGTYALDDLSPARATVAITMPREADGTRTYPVLNASGMPPVYQAMRIAGGEPVDTVINGAKTSSFYENIANPDTSNAVTIDRWMYKALIGEEPITAGKYGSITLSDLETLHGKDVTDVISGDTPSGARWKAPTMGIYGLFADSVRTVAAKYGMMPHEAQALIWSQIQGERDPQGMRQRTPHR